MFPIVFSDMTLASISWFASYVTTNQVPLHNPSNWSKFLNNIIGVPTFSLILWLGRLDVLREFRNSLVSPSNIWLSIVSDLSIESELGYSLSSPKMKWNQ